MKHYRILEKKIINLDNHKVSKIYIIQYLTPLIFVLSYWKNINKKYTKYEDALNDVKKIIVQDDYETPEVAFHYIDAYKIFKTQKK